MGLYDEKDPVVGIQCAAQSNHAQQHFYDLLMKTFP
jgi:hypothetical protein